MVPAELRTKNESDGGDKSSGSDDEVSTSSSQYARRNISSNWTKYELPSSSGEEEDELSAQELMTGQDFTAVVENAAGGSDTFFRLKSEKEWDEAQCLFQNDLFSLDLKDLEAAVGCIPLDAQIDLDMSDMNVRDIFRFLAMQSLTSVIFSSAFYIDWPQLPD